MFSKWETLTREGKHSPCPSRQEINTTTDIFYLFFPPDALLEKEKKGKIRESLELMDE